MTREEKELLLKEISARLPYGLIVQYKRKTFEPYSEYTADEKVEIDDMLHHRLKVLDCKPYLRPMSSMTDHEFGMDNKFYDINGNIYETIEDIEVEDISFLKDNNDGTYDYVIEFYNGCTWLGECIENELKKLL